jgi:hypothetical protein
MRAALHKNVVLRRNQIRVTAGEPKKCDRKTGERQGVVNSAQKARYT